MRKHEGKQGFRDGRNKLACVYHLMKARKILTVSLVLSQCTLCLERRVRPEPFGLTLMALSKSKGLSKE